MRAKKSRQTILDQQNMLVVKPSSGNMHKFVAEEDSCFFDICLPNYTSDSLRRITYFNEIADEIGEGAKPKQAGNTTLEYYTTPPVMPVGFDIAELDYRGDFQESSIMR